MKWITRERPKIDRIACPWLVTRFINKDAEFLYVPSGDVQRIAAAIALFRYRRNVIHVIAACAVVGLIATFFR